MGKKSDAPSLKSAAREADSYKKKLDKLVKECETALEDVTSSNRKEKMKHLYHDCVDLRNDLESLHVRISKMKKTDETTRVTNFDSKKDDELNRIVKFKTQLENMEKKLEPDVTEEDYYKKIEADLASEDFEASDEGEETLDEEEETIDDEEESYEDETLDEEEELEEEESESEYTDSQEPNVEYEAMHDFNKQHKDDLTLKAGDVVTLISVREDGWWECEDQDGNRGYVPSTYMKEHVKFKELMHDDTDTVDKNVATPRTGKALWGGIRKAVSETSATDVLSALGAVPAGFREPTSARLHSQGEGYTAENYLAVKLSPSNLFYKDLFFNPATGRPRSKTTRIQKVVTLIAAKNIPLPGVNTTVLSRLARVSLFDGAKFLSNITTVEAQCTDKEGRDWTFNVKGNILESAECFTRIDNPPTTAGVLIELSMIYMKQKGTASPNELCCGWTFMPWFAENGTLILNKEYQMTVNGGTPFEKNKEVDPSISRRTSSKLMTLISRNKQPQLILRTTAANKEQKERFDILPNVLVGKLGTLHPIALYRYHLSCVLLRDRQNIQSTESIYDPFLVHFPSLMEQPDLIDILLERWEMKLKEKGRNEKRDIEVLCTSLRDVFMLSVYPLMHMGLPQYKCGHQNVILARRGIIEKLIPPKSATTAAASDKLSPLANMLAPGIEHDPFDMSDVSYSVINKHCVMAV